MFADKSLVTGQGKAGSNLNRESANPNFPARQSKLPQGSYQRKFSEKTAVRRQVELDRRSARTVPLFSVRSRHGLATVSPQARRGLGKFPNGTDAHNVSEVQLAWQAQHFVSMPGQVQIS